MLRNLWYVRLVTIIIHTLFARGQLEHPCVHARRFSWELLQVETHRWLALQWRIDIPCDNTHDISPHNRSHCKTLKQITSGMARMKHIIAVPYLRDLLLDHGETTVQFYLSLGVFVLAPTSIDFEANARKDVTTRACEWYRSCCFGKQPMNHRSRLRPILS